MSRLTEAWNSLRTWWARQDAVRKRDAIIAVLVLILAAIVLL